jgi:hypothetical protein
VEPDPADVTIRSITCKWSEASAVAGQPVDQSGGIRAPPREIYGMNHFDRNGGCARLPTNWNVAVPMAYYQVSVDFAADSTGEERRNGGNEYGGWDNCKFDHAGEEAYNYLQVEGKIACYHRPGCMFYQTVGVFDGRLTITGNSHTVGGGTCHAIGFVKFKLTDPACVMPAPATCVDKSGEFYFGSRLPIDGVDCKDVAYTGDDANIVCATVGDVANPILDDGAAFSADRERGMAYGWDCNGALTFPVIAAQCIVNKSPVPVAELPSGTCITAADADACAAGSQAASAAVGNGDPLECRWLEASAVSGQPVDQSGGIRAPPREIYGMNHFDRNGGCAGLPTNWNVVVPDGYYDVSVDFAADSSGEERRQGGNDYGGWDNCKNDHIGEDAAGYLQVEGRITCYHRPGCMFNDVVQVTDGKLTITGYSHTVGGGTCHAIGFVKFSPGPPAPPPAANSAVVTGEFYFGSRMPTSEDCKDVAYTGDAANIRCAVIGDYAEPTLDDGAAFSSGRPDGRSYGWDCDGSLVFPALPATCYIDSSSDPVATLPDDTCTGADADACVAGSSDGIVCKWSEASAVAGQPVDQSGGIRAPPREIYGMNHFDRNGGCARLPTNWQVAVPMGYYHIVVDFAADSSGEERRNGGNEYGGWDNCKFDHIGEDSAGFLQVEGRIECYHRPGCISWGDYLVTDGKITITGNSHTVGGGTCHAIGFVKYRTADPACIAKGTGAMVIATPGPPAPTPGPAYDYRGEWDSVCLDDPGCETCANWGDDCCTTTGEPYCGTAAGGVAIWWVEPVLVRRLN